MFVGLKIEGMISNCDVNIHPISHRAHLECIIPVKRSFVLWRHVWSSQILNEPPVTLKVSSRVVAAGWLYSQTTEPAGEPLCPSSYLQLGWDHNSSHLVFLWVRSSWNLIRDALCWKDQLKVKCVYFSPGNAPGPPTSLQRMKFLWWEQDICSLSAHNPYVDSSALAHLLFCLCAPACVCVFIFSWLRAWVGVYALCALFVLVHAYLQYVSLGCMKWRRHAQVYPRWGCLHSGSRAEASLGPRLLFTAVGRPAPGERSAWGSRAGVHTT